jgi:hypothetical protein
MADEQQLLEIIASGREGILGAVTRAGYPHLTNVFFRRMIEERRLVVRLHVRRVYGVAMSAPPGS